MELNQFIDHTLLDPLATAEDFKQVCIEAKDYQFKAVCVPPVWVPLCKEQLKDTSVLIASVVGFPNGYNETEVKVYEIKQLLKHGVDEIDFVVNLNWVKSKDYGALKSELQQIREASQDKVIKAIIESGALQSDEIIQLCHLCADTGCDFVKTSTGFYKVKAQIEDVVLMRKNIPQNMKVKASGGIRTYEDAQTFIDKGADRIGCSASVQIMKESLI